MKIILTASKLSAVTEKQKSILIQLIIMVLIVIMLEKQKNTKLPNTGFRKFINSMRIAERIKHQLKRQTKKPKRRT